MIAPHQNMGAILTKMTNCKIVVVGDIMLDRFIHGQVDRISTEAPVPVLKLQGEHNMPGGAANVARNLAHLGVDVTLIGLVGKDQMQKFSLRPSQKNLLSPIARSQSKTA